MAMARIRRETNMSTQPSPGAMRAASEIMTADDPARFVADFGAEQEQRDMAEIIDRETGCAELLAALADCLAFWDAPPSGAGMDRTRQTQLQAIKEKARAAIQHHELRAAT